MQTLLNTTKGGRLIGYVRTVSLLPEKIINKNTVSYSTFSPTTASAINNFDTTRLHKQIIYNMTNVNVSQLGSQNHNSDVFLHKQYTSNFIQQHSFELSPGEFFNINGKKPPTTLDITAPDILKPVTSISEVATVGFISDLFPRTTITQSKQLIQKNSPLNFSKQISPDCKLEVKLNNGNLFTCWVDTKSMDFNVLQKRNMAYYKAGDKLECNFYFVGGLSQNHTFSIQETKGILHLAYNQCQQLVQTNDPIAISFVNQNIPFLTKFGNTGSILELQKSQIGPIIFSQPHFGLWFSSLEKY